MYGEPEDQVFHDILVDPIYDTAGLDGDGETVQEEGQMWTTPPEHISQLRVQTAISLNAFPSDLLGLIFEHTVGTVPALNLQLIRVTHVCQYWRDVALHSPALWTHIALKHPDAVKAFLERSQALPLRIAVDMTTSPVPEDTYIHALLAEYGRTLSFEVDLPSYGSHLVMKHIASAAPQLETLSITRGDSGGSADVMPKRAPADFDGVPRVRSLSIHGEFLPWLPKGPNALTDIDLTSALWDARTMLDLLERSPTLERVAIRGSFNTCAARDARRVTLARLKTLRMHSFSIAGIAALLPSLILPSKSTNIWLGCQRSGEGMFPDLLPAHSAPDALSFTALRGLKRVELLWSSTGYRTWRASRSSNLDDSTTPALQVEAYAWRPSLAERFLVNWPIDASHIETIDINGNHSDLHWKGYPQHWRTMLVSVPTLRTLRVRAVGEQTLHIILRPLASNAAPLMCPQLEMLNVAGIVTAWGSWGALVETVILSRSPAAEGCLAKVTVELPNTESAIRDGLALSTISEAGVHLIVTESE